MRTVRLVFAIGSVTAALFGATTASAQSAAKDEIRAIKQEILKLQQRLQRLEEAPAPAPATSNATAPGSAEPSKPAVAARTTSEPAPATIDLEPGEREITLERGHPLEAIGLSKPEIAGVRIAGFFVGSANYNTHTQMVPEFAGNANVTSEPGSLDFRFDQFTIGAFKTFAPWLSAGASIEVARHVHRHSHGFDPEFGCPGTDTCIEQFGAEEPETHTDLHRLNITGIAPLGNGLALSFGRFDTPYGIERHDAPLNLSASLSEVIVFGRPMSMTGFTASYQVAPWLDLMAWIANRWENETTEDPFEDNNRDKSFGGRIGFTPLAGRQLLNFGIGGWRGPEQDNRNGDPRWIVDFDVTWSPLARLLLAGELVYGGESGVSFRERGIPFPAAAVTDEDVNWLGFYALVHYDIARWLGLSFRYGLFDDQDGARTGVEQVLQSWTITPIVHLSRLIPELRPMGVTYARTRHPLDWVDLRFEYRLNHSSQPVFSDERPGFPILDADQTSHQATLQFVVNY
jgi:hypothetical protein